MKHLYSLLIDFYYWCIEDFDETFDDQNALVNTMNMCSIYTKAGSITHNIYCAKVQQGSHR